ncbi:HNH endonuclease family protein [Kitasatospora purpeofusca]|uniref:HNH endonuclease family protein n=1 Tax=Kitasatospora purpeofusca TaxID=67352 RepID=UPI0035D56B9A
MITTVRWRRRATVLAALAAVLLPAAAPAAASPAPTVGAVAARREIPQPPPVDVVRAELDELTVEAPHSMDGYSREKFPHWTKISGECDTRETVLARDGQDVVQDELCRAVAGTWTSLYDGKVSSDAKALDIDHVVPLAAAWRSGAAVWTAARREAYTNDQVAPNSLIAVSGSSNRSKSDKDPAAWMPVEADRCKYVIDWVADKLRRRPSADAAELQALSHHAESCPTTTVTYQQVP